MSETETLVKSYLAALADRDFDRVRTFLADRGFKYTSPIASFEEADRFIQHLSTIGPILERLDIHKLMVCGGEAIVILDTTVTLNGYVSYRSAMLFNVVDESIRSIEAIFDASDYHRMFLPDA
ncbi:MAG: nuclear transport factor 2 family protein [Chromatiales bacterium]|jgi:hypothetical protein